MKGDLRKHLRDEKRADEEKVGNAGTGLDLRGTLFKVFGTGLMSRLSDLSSSSCFLITGLLEEEDSIRLRTGG